MHLVEHQLLDGLERVLRSVSKPGWALFVLHLSRIATPGPRPYHRRTVAALLDNTAERCAGQLFALGNGDIAMLFRPPDDGVAVLTLIARLFGAETTALEALRSLWPIPAAVAEARRYIDGRIEEQLQPSDLPRTPEPEPPGHAFIRATPLPQLMVRQTVARLRPGTAQRMAPMFREVAIAPALLRGRITDDADPLLPSTIAAQLDRRVLDAALAGSPDGRLILGGATVPVHLMLTLAAVVSAAFARFAAGLGPEASARIWVELPFNEVFADPGTFILARERVRLAGMHLVLGQVSHGAFLLTRAEAAEPALLKLVWNPAMAQAGAPLAAAIERFGVERLVLTGCDTEAAVVWGLGLGIQLFGGGLIDTMLAAERLRGCPVGQSCTVGACRSRAATLDPAARAGCRNPGLLDAGLPPVAA